MMDVTLDDAYRMACQIIGEQIVQQRLIAERSGPARDAPGDVPGE